MRSVPLLSFNVIHIWMGKYKRKLIGNIRLNIPLALEGHTSP